ncbi:hypothetical protein CYMTET_42803 [Cymbomonas tetramitiformis]|uniref:Uncharacterized protein n=1 Tax=Cymbomonas tetramitiformis TaxID=36881 RepID=A0AAE0C5J8_9CHLO|nr:hypothetical protein CYMTET_42803 [Cymbomonas tetramitiformis]
MEGELYCKHHGGDRKKPGPRKPSPLSIPSTSKRITRSMSPPKSIEVSIGDESNPKTPRDTLIQLMDFEDIIGYLWDFHNLDLCMYCEEQFQGKERWRLTDKYNQVHQKIAILKWRNLVANYSLRDLLEGQAASENTDGDASASTTFVATNVPANTSTNLTTATNVALKDMSFDALRYFVLGKFGPYDGPIHDMSYEALRYYVLGQFHCDIGSIQVPQHSTTQQLKKRNALLHWRVVIDAYKFGALRKEYYRIAGISSSEESSSVDLSDEFNTKTSLRETYKEADDENSSPYEDVC